MQYARPFDDDAVAWTGQAQSDQDEDDAIELFKDWRDLKGLGKGRPSPKPTLPLSAGDGRPEPLASPANPSTTSSLPPSGGTASAVPHIPSSQDHQGPSQRGDSQCAPAPSNPGMRRSVLARQAVRLLLLAAGVISAILLALRGRS